MHSDYYMVMTTLDDENLASEIAKEMISRRLARCVNIFPGVRSIYSWQGEICDDQELVMIFKTINVKLEKLMESIREMHKYELPEIVALPITEGDADYLRWIFDWTSAEL